MQDFSNDSYIRLLNDSDTSSKSNFWTMYAQIYDVRRPRGWKHENFLTLYVLYHTFLSCAVSQHHYLSVSRV